MPMPSRPGRGDSNFSARRKERTNKNGVPLDACTPLFHERLIRRAPRSGLGARGSGLRAQGSEPGTQDEEVDEGLRSGMPRPPSSAASGCFEAGFCGAAAGFSSALRTLLGDGS